MPEQREIVSEVLAVLNGVKYRRHDQAVALDDPAGDMQLIVSGGRGR
jgi:hypothetical protein